MARDDDDEVDLDDYGAIQAVAQTSYDTGFLAALRAALSVAKNTNIEVTRATLQDMMDCFEPKLDDVAPAQRLATGKREEIQDNVHKLERPKDDH